MRQPYAEVVNARGDTSGGAAAIADALRLIFCYPER